MNSRSQTAPNPLLATLLAATLALVAALALSGSAQASTNQGSTKGETGSCIIDANGKEVCIVKDKPEDNGGKEPGEVPGEIGGSKGAPKEPPAKPDPVFNPAPNPHSQTPGVSRHEGREGGGRGVKRGAGQKRQSEEERRAEKRRQWHKDCARVAKDAAKCDNLKRVLENVNGPLYDRSERMPIEFDDFLLGCAGDNVDERWQELEGCLALFHLQNLLPDGIFNDRVDDCDVGLEPKCPGQLWETLLLRLKRRGWEWNYREWILFCAATKGMPRKVCDAAWTAMPSRPEPDEFGPKPGQGGPGIL